MCHEDGDCLKVMRAYTNANTPPWKAGPSPLNPSANVHPCEVVGKALDIQVIKLI